MLIVHSIISTSICIALDYPFNYVHNCLTDLLPKCVKKVVEWMELQKRMRVYELGSLPSFLFIFV